MIKSLDLLITDAEFLRHLDITAKVVGYDAEKIVDVLTSAHEMYVHTLAEKERLKLSSVYERLQDRLKRESKFFIFGKEQGAHSDYYAVVVQGYDDANKIKKEAWDIYGKTAKFDGSYRGSELLTTLLFDASVQLSYSLMTNQTDSCGRNFICKWILEMSEELCLEVVNFARSNPAQKTVINMSKLPAGVELIKYTF